MGLEYRTVEGALGAVDVLTGLTTFAGETGVGPIKVPEGRRKIVEIWVAAQMQIDTDTDVVAMVLRLSGKGMAQGEQDFILSNGYHEGTGAEVGPDIHGYCRLLPVQNAIRLLE